MMYFNGNAVLKREKKQENFNNGKILTFPSKVYSSEELDIQTPEEQPKKKGNYKVDEKQEVYPFRKQEDLEAMYNKLSEKKNKRDALLFVVGINVGLRAGDLLELKWRQILDFEDGVQIRGDVTIKEEKTDKFRTFYLNDSCKKELIKFYNSLKKAPDLDEYVFKSRKGGHVEVRSACKILKTAAKEVGIKYNVGTHSLRKTFGYWQLNAHKNDAIFLCELQELFNHSSPKITLRYCGLESEKMEQYYNDVNLL